MVPHPSNSHSSLWLILLVLSFALIVTGTVFVLSHESKKTNIPPTTTPKTQTTPQVTQSTLNRKEQQQIEQWIKENNLNEYGDPQDTVYTGGTPLFDETTGKRMNRFDFILKNHPDRPWND